MALMNKSLFAFMVILILGVAASPILSGTIYAQVDVQNERPDEIRDKHGDDNRISGLTLTSPTSKVLFAGSTVPITWTGGNQSWEVLISIIDMEEWTVAQIIVPNTPNDGLFTYTVPSTLPFDGSCGREYQFYIQNVQVTDWNYGPTFTIECERNPTFIEFEGSTDGWAILGGIAYNTTIDFHGTAYPRGDSWKVVSEGEIWVEDKSAKLELRGMIHGDRILLHGNGITDDGQRVKLMLRGHYAPTNEQGVFAIAFTQASYHNINSGDRFLLMQVGTVTVPSDFIVHDLD